MRLGKILSLANGFVTISLLSLLIGCASTVDLDAVQKYGQTAAAAKDSFAAVAADFAASCARRRELSLPPKEMADTTISYKQPYLIVSLPSPPPTPVKGNLNDPHCVDADAISEEWAKRNDIVLGYVQKLGEIAGVDAQPSFAPLGDALQNSGVISSTENSAFETLANDFSRAIVAGDLRGLIAQTVIEANQASPSPSPFPAAIAALKEVDGAYGQVLHDEFQETYTYYHCLIAYELTQKPPKGSSDFSPSKQGCATVSYLPNALPWTLRERILQQRISYSEALNAVNQHSAASVSYANVLDEMEQTNKVLYDKATGQAQLSDYVSELQKTIIPLYRDVDALAKAVR